MWKRFAHRRTSFRASSETQRGSSGAEVDLSQGGEPEV